MFERSEAMTLSSAPTSETNDLMPDLSAMYTATMDILTSLLSVVSCLLFGCDESVGRLRLDADAVVRRARSSAQERRKIAAKVASLSSRKAEGEGTRGRDEV